jgi:Probable cobalt transporter subunit (CbtB)
MEEAPMATITAAARNTAINLPTWVWLAMMLAVGLLYAVTFDSGLLSARVATSSMFLHEFFHDGRHLFGVPCH